MEFKHNVEFKLWIQSLDLKLLKFAFFYYFSRDTEEEVDADTDEGTSSEIAEMVCCIFLMSSSFGGGGGSPMKITKNNYDATAK